MVCQLSWTSSKTDAEVKLRIRPLREQWEARGPGLLKHVTTRLSWLQIPERISVLMVSPTNGGGGRILSPTEIEFEAVLANPRPQLPEVVRLGWLCACVSPETHPRSKLALIPPIISAAEYVELARFDESAIQYAIQDWLDDDDSMFSGRQLLDWWDKVGLTAMDRVAWEQAIAHL